MRTTVDKIHGTKVCGKCGCKGTIDDFGYANKNRKYWRSTCRKCASDKARQRNAGANYKPKRGLTHQICCTCKHDLPITQFYKNRVMRTGYQGQCNACRKTFDTRYRINGVPQNRDYLRWYGISFDDYTRLLTQQRGVCGICHQPETTKMHGKTKSLAVDHDHKTGRVRGLLCHRCNFAIGLLRYNEKFIQNAANWIQTPKKIITRVRSHRD